MMLTLLLESAARSLALGLAVWCGLKLFRVRGVQVERIVWTVVLIAALAMPLLMQWRTVTVPAPAVATVWSATATPVLPIENGQVSTLSSPDARSAPESWSTILSLVYGVVASLFLLRLSLGLALTLRLIRKAEPLAGRDDLHLRVSSDVLTPFTFGSTILLP